jgi:hypothetical protein
MISMWLLGLTLALLAGLNAPLGMVALYMAAASTPVILRPELTWVASPPMLWVWGILLVLQCLADLYFVPATVRDRAYVHEARVLNNYLHARFQSLFRPLIAALALGALPTALSSQMAAVFGFLIGTTVYWGTAWMREQVASRRGAVILLIGEVAKNLFGLGIALMTASFAPVGLAVLVGLLSWVAQWASRLRREQALYPAYGGHVAPKDS